MKTKEKKKISFPSAFTVLFIVLIIAMILTYLVPAGSYERLAYNVETDEFVKIGINGEETSFPATEEFLKENNNDSIRIF